jgi:sirohydrochlorin cobaltochelatase
MRAIVLFAHGSRDPLWHRPIQAVAQRIQAQQALLAEGGQPMVNVACAYLELSTPSLSDAVQTLVEQGCTHIRLVPLFLGVGKHVREDLPAMLQSLRDTHSQVVFEPLPAVGEHPDLLDLMARIAVDGWE